jgi:hypothetical protein
MPESDMNGMEKTLDAVQAELHEIKGDLASIKRTLVGEPFEGNTGILSRMERTEKRVAILLWTLPIWITGGTAVGQYLVQLWGL